MKRILVTGGAGFIGSHLCKRLNILGYDVVAIDKLHSQVHGENPSETSESYKLAKEFCEIVVDDVCSVSTWMPFFNIEFDAIVCLAAETGTGQSMVCAQSYCNTNVGSIALLNDLIVANRIKTKTVVLASSRSVYGDAYLDKRGNPTASRETDLTNPQSIYAITKLSQERVLFTGFGNTHVSALRFQNVYGPRQSLKNPYTGILSIFSTAIKNGKPIQIFEDGMMSRDFVHVDDVVDSLILAIRGLTQNREVYNVGSGERVTVLAVAETLKKHYNSDITIDITGERLRGDIRHNFADITKIQSIGYQPKVKFADGIADFTQWVNSSGDIEYNNYSDSISLLRSAGILKKIV